MFHFTRTPGCIKINDLERYKSCLPNQKKLLLDSFLVTHYQYLEDIRPIRHKALVILIPCNNCNKHKINPENCQFILDSKNRIFGFSFKITNKNSELYYMFKNNFLESMKVICFEWRINPFYMITKKSSSKPMKLANNLILTIVYHITTGVQILIADQSRPCQTKKLISLFSVRFLKRKFNFVLRINMNKLQQ